MKKPSSTVPKYSPNDPLPEGFVDNSTSQSWEGIPFPEEPDNGDYDWALSDLDLHRQYSGKVVAILNRVVWGVGKNHLAAWDDARAKPDCPAQEQLTFVAIP